MMTAQGGNWPRPRGKLPETCSLLKSGPGGEGGENEEKALQSQPGHEVSEGIRVLEAESDKADQNKVFRMIVCNVTVYKNGL